MLMANAPAANVGLHGRRQGRRARPRVGLRLVQRGDRARRRPAPAGPRRRRRWSVAPRPSSTRCRSRAFAQMQALSRRNDEPERASRPGTRAATASSWARARRSWCSRTLEHGPRRAAPRSTAPSPAPASPPTATTSSSPTPRARASPPPCSRRSRDAGPGGPPTSSHVNAHGTSTPQGDVTEAGSIRTALGDAGRRRGHLHQVDDRPPARWRRRPGDHRDRPGPARPDGAADDQPATTPSPTWASTSPPTSRARCRPATWPRSTTPSASAATTSPSPSPTPTPDPRR